MGGGLNFWRPEQQLKEGSTANLSGGSGGGEGEESLPALSNLGPAPSKVDLLLVCLKCCSVRQQIRPEKFALPPLPPTSELAPLLKSLLTPIPQNLLPVCIWIFRDEEI